jgi:Asp-tRNA(Asn)/Glu-tRNA(Gln) amidotransferase A subunit family amidase
VLHTEPLADTADKLRLGHIDTDTYLKNIKDRIGSIDPSLESFVSEEDRWGRIDQRVELLQEQYPTVESRPPLYGVPIGVKDIFPVSGMSTRAGSGLPADLLTGPEASAVTTLKDAGAVVLGKTVTTEFAHMSPGPTRNPHDKNHTPGGSSSGSAAAVAAGLCPMAFGTQTIGSVIRPASFCGIVGYKPTYGRISKNGVIPLSTSVDHVGTFTQDTEGTELIASLLCDSWRSLPSPANKPRLGVPQGSYLEQAEEVGLEAYESALDVLSKAGYDIVRLNTLENIKDINTRHEELIAADAAVAHEDWYRVHNEKYAKETKQLIEEGLESTAKTIAVGRRGRKELRENLSYTMDEHNVDMWIAPAAPGPAPEGIDSTGDPVMNLPWTHSGLPTVTVPAATSDKGLPIGIQCSGKFDADEDVIRWMHNISDILSE